MEGIVMDDGASAMDGAVSQEAMEGVQEAPQIQKPQDDFSRRFELLARKEREFQSMQSRYKSQAQQWQEKEAKLKQYEEDYGIIESDPLSFLSKRGWDMDKLTDHMINSTSDPYAKKYEQKIGELEKRFDQEKEERIKEIRHRTFSAKINEINDYVSKDQDRFELINANNAQELVLNTMAEYFNEYGEALSVDRAAEQVENYLEKQLDKMVNYKKLKSKMGQFEKPQEPENDGESNYQQPSQHQQRRPSTLTNSFAPVNTPNSNRILSKEESLKRAASLIKWND